MTCIVGYVNKITGETVIGADSAGALDWDIVVRKDTKIFRKGEFIFGCTSSFRMIQLLRFSLQMPPVNEKDIFEYMCTDFVDSVRACFTTGGYLQKFKDGDEKGGDFLVGYKNRLFNVACDFQVGEAIVGYDAVGSGARYALGALHSLEDQLLTVEERVKQALLTATYFSGGVRPPYTILKTPEL